MKRYIRGSYSYKPKTEEYRGYFIDRYTYDNEPDEYVVDIDLAGDGDEHFFSTEHEAREFIDNLYLMENVNKKLGF